MGIDRPPPNGIPCACEADAIHRLRDRIGAPLPGTLEILLVRFSWLTVDPDASDDAFDALGGFMLLANPPGPTLDGFWSAMDYGKFRGALIRAQFLPIARDAFGFDPVCIDLRSPRVDQAPIVSIDHERLLQFGKASVRGDFAPTFEDWWIGCCEGREQPLSAPTRP